MPKMRMKLSHPNAVKLDEDDSNHEKKMKYTLMRAEDNILDLLKGLANFDSPTSSVLEKR